MTHFYSKGITLVELVVTLSIITILLALATIAFNDYQVNYNVEGEIKTLYSDIQGARMHAMNENRPYVFKFTSDKSYVVAVDSDADGDYNAGDIKVDKYSKDSLKYPINLSLLDSSLVLLISSNGLVSVPGYDGESCDHCPDADCKNCLYDRLGFVSVSGGSSFDCIAFSPIKVKVGKLDGGVCKPV